MLLYHLRSRSRSVGSAESVARGQSLLAEAEAFGHASRTLHRVRAASALPKAWPEANLLRTSRRCRAIHRRRNLITLSDRRDSL
ncbi:MAG: hypothetical protein F6J94_18885 [Moorea sp. SIO1F2]|uniref:hypothetical protein n=1 Tax=unclassified Moorena TaxID=2683338 RepID=UPI0013B8430D|nr:MULTISPECIES: hypothetical protein [unclassified Moorena]NEN97516.1 hypothetical protein [Moorena sp. SIO3I7]NEO05231.1 hypothetical protein [Moorena sp. SIO3I8]NET83909.1 hypothetical protein [Moorena sp. SIO1F2]